MSWFVAVIIGHLLNALGFVLNKAALNVAIKNAGAFTFYVGFLGLIALALFPLGFFIPQGFSQWWPLIAGGVAFMVALLSFTYALSMADTSKVAPFIGALVPIFTFVLEYALLGRTLTGALLVSFVVLVVGTIVITVDLDVHPATQKARSLLYTALPWVLGAVAALAFALSFVASKIAYDAQPFWGAFVWMRLISFVTVLFLLFVPTVRKAIIASKGVFVTRNGLVYIASQVVGGVSFIFINYAISLTSVTLVNAMQGVQYAFLIILVLIGHVVAPKMVAEAMGKKTLVVRSVGVVIIAVGIAIASYAS